jgi:hypothetical protein
VVDVIGDVITSENYLYAVRITGEFDWIRTAPTCTSLSR